MKWLLILTILVILASCGNNRLRLQRVKLFNQQEIVSVDHERKAESKDYIVKSEKETSPQPSLAIEKKNHSEEAVFNDETVNEMALKSSERIDIYKASIIISDTLENKEKIAQALEAEKNAKRATGFLIGSFVGFFALLVPGIVLFIFGAIYYHRAKNSRYISEKGQNSLQFARVFYFIDFILAAALVIGITGIIISNVL